MLETIVQIAIAVNIIWFIQWLAYRERREYKEYRQWKKQGGSMPSPEPPKAPDPPVDHPDVIILERYRQAR